MSGMYKVGYKRVSTDLYRRDETDQENVCHYGNGNMLGEGKAALTPPPPQEEEEAALVSSDDAVGGQKRFQGHLSTYSLTSTDSDVNLLELSTKNFIKLKFKRLLTPICVRPNFG